MNEWQGIAALIVACATLFGSIANNLNEKRKAKLQSTDSAVAQTNAKTTRDQASFGANHRADGVR
jgi:hypothetical protein